MSRFTHVTFGIAKRISGDLSCRKNTPCGWRNSVIIPVIALTVASLLSCGGGGTGNGASSQLPEFSSIIEGRVIKGPIAGADVQAFSVDENGVVSERPLAQTVSDAEGNYRLDLGAFHGALQVVATMRGTSIMRDEATGESLTPLADLRLRALSMVDAPLGRANVRQNGQQIQTITISPFSELAANIAGKLGHDKPSSSHIRASLVAVRDALGFDPVSTPGIESGSVNAAYANPDSRMNGLALAAVSWLAKHGTNEDQQTQTCLQRALDDGAKRLACAVDLVQRIVTVDPVAATVEPRRDALAFTSAIKQAEKNPELNNTAMKLSVAPAMLQLEQGAANPASRSGAALNSNSGSMSGTAAAKKLLENLRSNGDAIDVGMNEEGITASLTELGRSLEQTGNMAIDMGNLLDMLNDGIVFWNDYRAGIKPSSSFNNLPIPSYGAPAYFACTIFSSYLPPNLLDAPFFGPVPKGSPYVMLSPTEAQNKTSTPARRTDPRLLVDTTGLAATQPSEARWLGCSRFSREVPSLVATTVGTGTELNSRTRYRQMLRMRVDAQDASGRPTRVSFVGMSVKQYPQAYSSSDPWPVTRRVNLLDNPLQGVIVLTWNGQQIASARILGDLPPSVDDTMTRSTSGIFASRDMVRASRYSADAQVSFVYNDSTTRIDLPKVSLGLVRVGAATPELTFETDPDGQPGAIVVPKTDGCATISSTRLNIAARIQTLEGGLKGQVAMLAPPDCGSTTEPVNGSVQFNGVLNAKNKSGQLVEVGNASLRVTAANRVPTVLLQGRMFIPAREPMDLLLSVSATEATPRTPGTLSAQLSYRQGNYSLMFTGLEQETYAGSRIGRYFSMTGTGGISAAWVDGDKTVYLKENGKAIGEIDTRTGWVLFNDGSFQFIR